MAGALVPTTADRQPPLLAHQRRHDRPTPLSAHHPPPQLHPHPPNQEATPPPQLHPHPPPPHLVHEPQDETPPPQLHPHPPDYEQETLETLESLAELGRVLAKRSGRGDQEAQGNEDGNVSSTSEDARPLKRLKKRVAEVRRIVPKTGLPTWWFSPHRHTLKEKACPDYKRALALKQKELEAQEKVERIEPALAIHEKAIHEKEGAAFVEEGPAFVVEEEAAFVEGAALLEEGAAFVEEATAFVEEGAALVEEGAAFVQEASRC